jgi:hypothetical protein
LLRAKFKQVERFWYCSHKIADSEAQEWWVSLAVTSSLNPKAFSLHDLKSKKGKLTFPVNGAEWLKVNAGQSGFYRVKYSGTKNKLVEIEFRSRPFVETEQSFGQAFNINN